jgi:hypothetical protein
MATSNFHNVNATHIFAVQLEDEWSYDDLVSNLESEFKTHKDYYDYGKIDPYELRSFPSKSLGSFSNSLTIGEDEIEVYITPVIRSGYYEGCNLDWHIRCYVNGYEDYELEYTTKVKSLINEYVDFIENIYSQYSEPLGVTARFSNGETIYHKVA